MRKPFRANSDEKERGLVYYNTFCRYLLVYCLVKYTVWLLFILSTPHFLFHFSLVSLQGQWQ
jgi:hypothetical protein